VAGSHHFKLETKVSAKSRAAAAVIHRLTLRVFWALPLQPMNKLRTTCTFIPFRRSRALDRPAWFAVVAGFNTGPLPKKIMGHEFFLYTVLS